MVSKGDTTHAKALIAANNLCNFIKDHGQSPFHVVEGAVAELGDATYLPEGAAWSVRPGETYYTTRNGSSLIAFRVGRECVSRSFRIAAAHTDAPTFKVKPCAEIEGPAGYRRLNVEAYGGTIDYTWFDRPLKLAGRAMVKGGSTVRARTFCTAPIAIIPSVAIHMNRNVNEGFAVNRKTDVNPLMATATIPCESLGHLVEQALGVSSGSVVSMDACLVNGQEPMIWGANAEFVSAPKLDDVACAYSAVSAFAQSHDDTSISVCALFDNEEVGSNTKQGAMSTFLADTLARISAALGATSVEHLRALSRSVLLSCDNAHAMHPNHPELSDASNAPVLNGGIAIKEAANQKYCSDAFSRALFGEVCSRAQVPVQSFANRSDMAGGSTLGNLSNTQVSLHGVDIGIPQLAMHSSYETCGVFDVLYAQQALTAFYNANIEIDEAASFTIG